MRPLLVAVLVLAGAILAGCAGKPPERVVDVTIARYHFEPGTNVSLNATKGETLLLRLTSLDVTHGFAITEYGIDAQVPPGRVTTVRLVADKVGDFVIYCTVFCGTGHPQHKGVLHVR